MSSTRIISVDFECRRPATLAEALENLLKEGAQVLAGGTDLINSMKTNAAKPRCLVWVLGVKELNYIKFDQGLTIGAGTRLSEIELNERVAGRYPALVEAINAIGGTQIRNMATLAGNLCNASPGADTPPILLALGAEVEICCSNGPGLQRTALPLKDFFTGPKMTVLKPGQMLTSVFVPQPPVHSGAAFRRLARVSLDIAKINCAVYLEREGDSIRQARVALGSVAPTPVRAPKVEETLKGQKKSESLFHEAAVMVENDIAPITDVRSSADYRRQAAGLLLREALMEAWKRSGGK
ncbi:MAG: xanthine dehydrogenase family protein subunit M [Spirochaetota bacterium]